MVDGVAQYHVTEAAIRGQREALDAGRLDYGFEVAPVVLDGRVCREAAGRQALATTVVADDAKVLSDALQPGAGGLPAQEDVVVVERRLDDRHAFARRRPGDLEAIRSGDVLDRWLLHRRRYSTCFCQGLLSPEQGADAGLGLTAEGERLMIAPMIIAVVGGEEAPPYPTGGRTRSGRDDEVSDHVGVNAAEERVSARRLGREADAGGTRS